MLDFTALIQLALSLLTALVGFPTLLSMILTALEYFNKIDEALADKISFFSNAFAFVGIFYLAATGRLDLINQIDLSLGAIAKVLSEILILLGIPTSFAFTKFFQDQFRKAKFVGLR